MCIFNKLHLWWLCLNLVALMLVQLISTAADGTTLGLHSV